jgi:hypothetical protein
MRLAHYATLNFNINVSTAAVLLDIERAFDTTCHSGLLYELSELKFSASLINRITSFLTERTCKVFHRRRIFYAKKDSGMGSLRFRPCPNIVQSMYKWCPPRHLELILLCSRTIPVFTRQKNTNVVFSVNCNATSLQWIRVVSVGT